MERSGQQRVTQRDLARRLGVDRSTVSRALADDPRITEAVRLRVQKMAQALGYRPDPMLTALAHYRQARVHAPVAAALAWINARPDPRELRSFREFDLYWHGAEAEAREAGYHLEEFHLHADLHPDRLEKILLTRGIRGILIPPHSTTPEWGSFDWSEFCLVRFGYSVTSPRAHVVTSDQLTDGLIACRSMWERGYARIGLVTRPWAITRFSAGYAFAHVSRNSQLPLPPCIIDRWEDRKVLKALQTWLNRTHPDAILTDVPELRGWLTALGHRAPEDLGLATLTVLDGGDIDAGIDQQSEEIGRAAVQMLLSLIHHNERGIPAICRELLVEGKWVDGQSLPRKA